MTVLATITLLLALLMTVLAATAVTATAELVTATAVTATAELVTATAVITATGTRINKALAVLTAKATITLRLVAY